MASPRHERREGRTEPTLAAVGPEESDERLRRTRRHEHHDHREHHNHRGRDEHRHRRHRSAHPRHDQGLGSREDTNSSGRNSTGHDHHERRDHREHRGHRDHRHGHDDHHRHSRHHSKDRSTERAAGRRHQRHDSPRHEKRRDHHDTQMVIFRKDEPGRGDNSKEADRDARGDGDDSLFAIDTRGDPLIWQYGANDRGRVPAYHRYRDGRIVLGTQKRLMFGYEGAKVLFSVAPADGSGGQSVFRDKNNPLLLRALHGSAHPKSRRPHDAPKKKQSVDTTSKASKSSAVEADFVPLRSSKKRKRGVDVGSESEPEGHGSGGDTETEATDDSTSSTTSLDDKTYAEGDNIFVVGDETREVITQKLSELSRRVKEEPQDVDAWLELVDLQDQQGLLLGNDDIDRETAGSSFTSKHERSKDEITGISKVKLSMLESALRQVRSSSDQERLQLAIMREGAKVWTPKQMAQRWTDLAHGDDAGAGLNFLLWKARLDFEMTNLSDVTVDGIKRFIVHRLRGLETKATEGNDDVAKKTELYAQMIYVFLRATRFIFDAGFRDLATAAWQATLEVSFARPPADTRGASLGQFWDSEIPRIGEEGAQGWRSYASAIQNGQDAEEALLEYSVQNESLPNLDLAEIAHLAGRDEVHDIDEYTPLYEAWVVVERQRAALAKLPARVIDDIDDGGYEDVFRVVVFSDLESLLFSIPETLLQTLQPLLIDAFLLFCQLPPAFGQSTWIEMAREDPFLAIIVLPGDTDAQAEDLDNKALGESTGRSPPDLFYDGSRIFGSPDVLFSRPGWFRYLPDWLRPSTSDPPIAPVPPQWVANTLRQLVRSFGVEELAPYSLAVDAAVNPAGVKKAARTLLKQYISNNALYEAYALAEASRGNDDVARTVLSSATANITDVEAELSLRQTWAWIELESGKRDEAIRRLDIRPPHDDGTSISSTTAEAEEKHSISPAQLLRARHTLRTGMDYGLSANHVRRAALFAQGFVLLEYLSAATHGQQRSRKQQSRQGDLSAAMSAATAFSDEMQARGHSTAPDHERFLQWVARIIYFHASHGPYKPAELQAPLQKMVILFPRNGVFLRLFGWIDPAAASGLSRLRSDDPLRQILDNVVLARENDCPSSRAFAIRYAIQSGHGQGHAARAAFERALGGRNGNSDYNYACLGNSRLWQAYVHLTAMEAMATAPGVDRRKRRVRGVDKRMVALAKDVYYRAVRACPGSKDVLLEAFGPNTGLVTTSSEAGMTPSDLRAVFHTVLSKGLRVHVDLTEVRDRVKTLSKEHKR